MKASLDPVRHRPGARRPVWVGALAAAAALMVAASPASAINRCEARDGRITYTNEPCPPDSRSVRKVDDSPPVRLPEARARSRDAKEAEPAATETKAAEPVKAATAPVLTPTRRTESASPAQEIERLDELRAHQQRQCALARRRAEFAAADVQAATGSDRASAELALRRAQEDARAVCPPQ